MSIVRTLSRAVPIIAFAIGLYAAVPARAEPALSAMSTIQPGVWAVQVGKKPPRAMCVANPEALFQIRHRGNACSRLVIADGKDSATVHYSCPGAGWGRTMLRVSTARAVRISTQGIAANAPFDFDASARRIGDCPTVTASR